MRKIVVMATIAMAVLLSIPAAASASIRLVPSKVEMQVAPGEVTSFTVTLQNAEAGSLEVSSSAWDFARDSKGVPQPITGTEGSDFHGCARWLALPATSTLAAAGKNAAVQVVVRVPDNVSAGSYFTYLSLLASPPAQNQDGLRMAYDMAALVVLTVVPPGGSPTGSLDAPKFDRSVSIGGVAVPRTVMDGSVPLSAVLVNTGNVHADVKTRFEIVSGGRVVASIPMKDFTLLPGDRFPLAATWSKPPLLGTYTARFVAEVVGEKPLTRESSFWVVSWTAVFIAATSVLLLAATVLVLRRYVHVEFRRDATESVTE